MKKKYYAYMGKRGCWTVKRYHGDDWFFSILKAELKPTSRIAAYLLPWETVVTKKQWETLPETDRAHPAMMDFYNLMPGALTRFNSRFEYNE